MLDFKKRKGISVKFVRILNFLIKMKKDLKKK